ncbi:MAG: hypothetical protein L0922_06355 [Candidatus Mariimomonas ferrooxydans]
MSITRSTKTILMRILSDSLLIIDSIINIRLTTVMIKKTVLTLNAQTDNMDSPRPNSDQFLRMMGLNHAMHLKIKRLIMRAMKK